MPMPKPEKPEDLRVGGKVPTRLVKVQKTHLDHPNLANEMVKRAESIKKAREAGE